MPLRPEDLPDDLHAVKSVAVRLFSENEHLHEALRLLNSKLYAPHSERIVWNGNLQELLLFGQPEPPPEEGYDSEKASKTSVGSHERKKRGRKPIPEHLPRVVTVVDVPESEKTCGCGLARPRMGQEVSEQLDIIPASVQILQRVRPKYAPCPKCERAEDASSPAVLIAPVPPQIIPKSIASPGLLAHVLTAKFVDSTPFYRQEKQFLRMGVEVMRATMCGWAIKVAEACTPLMECLRDEVLSGPVVGVDETTLQVLKEPGRAATTDSYLWHFRGGQPEHETLFYMYAPSRAGDVAWKFLQGYIGGVHTDGFSGYDWVDVTPGMVHLGCMAHLRRNFVDVLKAASKPACDLTGTIAGETVKRIKDLYEIEQLARDLKMSRDERFLLRQTKAKPLLDSLHTWLERQEPVVPRRSLLGKAIKYALNQWRRVVRYIDDGDYWIDNNRTENGIRPFVVGRKNWLFADTVAGAKATASLYTLVETAKANGLDPYWYLRCLFERLPMATSKADHRALIPQYFDRQLIVAARAAAGP